MRILSIGATGSIGRHVVEQALAAGHTVRALVRDPAKAGLPEAVEVVTGDITDPGSLGDAVAGIDAIVFTHGSHVKETMEAVDYGGVRSVLAAVGKRPVRIALMTAIGVTNHDNPFNLSTGILDWKRRSERLVRASGHPYTIVRPGWFDYNADDQLSLRFLQGDTRRAGGPEDGVIARRQIAQVLIEALTCDDAVGKTFELVAETGPAPERLDSLFATLDADPADGVDGVRDADTLPLDGEPEAVLADLEAVRG